MFAILALLACACDPPAPVVEPTGPSFSLLHTPLKMLEIPDDSRGGAPLSTWVALDGPWESIGQEGTGHTFKMAAPFRSRAMFFMRAQPGMRMRDAMGRTLPYRRRGRGDATFWNYTLDTVSVVQPSATPPTGFTFSYPRAGERELALNFMLARAAGLVESKQAFAVGAEIQEGYTSRSGLLLPAPGLASWSVTLPEAPVLTMSPGVVRPELGDLPAGDGCRLVVEIEGPAGTEVVFDEQLKLGDFSSVDVDLSTWAQQSVTVTMRTDPNASPIYDYCFIGDPRIHPKRVNPRRVVMIFVDTLRPDHLSLHGYGRETTPNLDAFAEGAVVFENARSVAPWTLPSARSVVTGRQPEHYGDVPTLQTLLKSEGFATGMIAGNVYLSTNFDMGEHWGEHEVGVFPPANEVTDSALAWLDAHQGQDSLLMVHYMSAHLPYLEPPEHRRTWAGDAPPGLQREEFHLQDVRKARLKPVGQQYVRDRYDNCIHWIDEELERLYSTIDDNDIVVFFSDHGEEFWEHGGYEHGHTLYDELLRVPLVIRAPGLNPGRVSEPVSLLDVTPTLLDLLDIEPIKSDGQSLVPTANGDPTTRSMLEDRTLGFGRPLYGMEKWGVLHDGKKWMSHQGVEELYDLSTDPGEEQDLSANPVLLPPMRQKMGESLGTALAPGFRFAPTRGVAKVSTLKVRVHIPGGIRAAWAGQDPRDIADLTVERIDDETVTLTWDKGSGVLEAFVLPVEPAADALKTMEVTASQGAAIKPMAMPTRGIPELGRSRNAITSQSIGKGRLQIGWSLTPIPPQGSRTLNATDDEVKDWMAELGYEEREDDNEDEEEVPKEP